MSRFTCHSWRIWPVLLLAWLSACASPNLSSEELAAIRRVAIISNIGSQMSTVEFAMIPIVSEALIDPIDELGFDRFVAEAIAGRLAPRFEIVDEAGAGADAYIEVIPGTGMLYGTHFPIRGVYMATHPHMLGDEERDIGVLCHLRVVDARSRKVLKSQPIHAFRPIGRENWAPRFSDLTPDQKEAARNLLEDGMAESLDAALRRLGLVT